MNEPRDYAIAKAIARTVMAFVLSVRHEHKTLDACYERADMFLANLGADLEAAWKTEE